MTDMELKQRTDDAGRALQSLMQHHFNYDHDSSLEFVNFVFALIDARVQQELGKHIKEQHDEAK